MLLRSSRMAGHLTKTALLGAVAGAAAKGTLKAGKGVLGNAGRHWKGIGGTALVGAPVASAVSQGAQRVGAAPQPPQIG